ncbi:F-box domain containing protein [Pandoravirus neocaledonia]|uniref:F-box domain containing protein n=1 Tax=Pandoravirus neocaledonia TaxID=2107708 RepID=A0A2U7UAZ0_9VIRU|nr:F-box domain containing protein [Pandoravirus neocaledonia]AVK75621.1 F-box domain containing protein [Pandoravirus neocaledonia]
MEPPTVAKRKRALEGKRQTTRACTARDDIATISFGDGVPFSSAKRLCNAKTSPAAHRAGATDRPDGGGPFSALPDEILTLIFQGRALGGPFILDPRWRALVAMTCRRWRRIVATPSYIAVAALDRVRPPRASPQAWAIGRVICASALRDAVLLLPPDMGAINAWLTLVLSLDYRRGSCGGRGGDGDDGDGGDVGGTQEDVSLSVALAVAASGNTTAIRDVRRWGLDDPTRRVPADWFEEYRHAGAQDHGHRAGADADPIDQVPGDGHHLTVAWAVVLAACKSPLPHTAIDWAVGRWGSLFAAQQCDPCALSLDIALTGSPTVLDAIIGSLNPAGRRALWNNMMRACLVAPSADATDALLARLLEMVDGRDEHMALETAIEAVARSVHDREERPERVVGFVPWLGKAKRWCLLAFYVDRPRAAATAIDLWGVPDCPPPRHCPTTLGTSGADQDDAIAAAFDEMDGDDAIDIDGLMEAYGADNGEHVPPVDAADDDNSANDQDAGQDAQDNDDDRDANDDDDDIRQHQQIPSPWGFWCAAVVHAISGGATASLDWLLAKPSGNDGNGGAGPLARSTVETPELALRAVTEALCMPMGDATRLLIGLRHFAGLVPTEPIPATLIASALEVCARGVDLYFASGVILAALAVCPDTMRSDTLLCDLASAVGGLLRAREWGTLDALVTAVDAAPPDLFGRRGGFDLWMAAALDCRRASATYKTASIVEVHNRSKALYFLAMRAGALPADALVADVIDDRTRRDSLAPDAHTWRRWCRVRPIVLDRTATDMADATGPDGILSPVDPAWTALWSCGLLRAADAHTKGSPCN